MSDYNSPHKGTKKFRNKSNKKSIKRVHLSNKAKKKMIKVLSCVVAAILLLSAFTSIKKSNQQKLSQYHESMIGNTYGDNKEITFRIGQDVERTVLEILDEDTLSFKKGTFSTSFKKQATVNSFIVTGTTIYKEEDVSKPINYEYTLSISITGKVTISFNGVSYPVKIEDGTVEYIDMY